MMGTGTTTRPTDDTSLALPSDGTVSSGSKRVLNQVHSIKRNKNKSIKNGSLSPTSPVLSPKAEFKSLSLRGNGFMSTTSTTFSKTTNTQKFRSQSTKSGRGTNHRSASTWTQVNSPTELQKPNGLKLSHSESALTQGRASSKIIKQSNAIHVIKRSTSSIDSNVQNVQPTSCQSQSEVRVGSLKASGTELTTGTNSAGFKMDLNTAIMYLSKPEEHMQQAGASFIQHITFSDETARDQVVSLGGLLPLVKLLSSSNKSVSQMAAGAMRNLVFKNHNNKLEVQKLEGDAKALQLLEKTSCTDIQKQVTGFLWNMSSAPELKEGLIKTAVPVLSKNVVKPFVGYYENADFIEPTVFFYATGCLRNLSSCSREERQKFRKCPDLIPSLISFISSCVAEERYDDQSMENTVCILQNLTYELEEECPNSFSSYNTTREDNDEKKKQGSTVGCFGPRSKKALTEKNSNSSTKPEESSVKTELEAGVYKEDDLCQLKTIDNYLSLLKSSKNIKTKAACCGALQNLTVGTKPGARAISEYVYKKLEDMCLIPSLLESTDNTILLRVVSLLDNIARNTNVNTKQCLPGLLTFLTNYKTVPDQEISAACTTVRRLLETDPKSGISCLDRHAVEAVVEISESSMLKKGKTAALLLLYNMWNKKPLQSALKKLDFEENTFINDETKNAHTAALAK